MKLVMNTAAGFERVDNGADTLNMRQIIGLDLSLSVVRR